MHSQSQYHFPEIDACKLIEDLLNDISHRNLDYETLNQYFDARHEIELTLEFNWCKTNKIEEKDCQIELPKYIGDTSLTLKRIFNNLLPFDSLQLTQCKNVDDQLRTSDYIVKINNDSYVIRFDKKCKAIFDIIKKDGSSLFTESDYSKNINKKLVNRYFN